MDERVFGGSNWYHAVNLRERAASLAENPLTQPRQRDSDSTLLRLARWRSQPPFAKDGYFARRLAADGLSEESLFGLLDEPIEAVQDRYPALPAWLRELDEAYSHPTAREPFAFPAALRDMAGASFLDVVGPLIRRGCVRLKQAAARFAIDGSHRPFDPTTVDEIFLGNLCQRLSFLLGRTLTLELNVARLQGLLEGGTPEARFESFRRRLCDPQVSLCLLQEYSVLARQLVTCVDNWVTVSGLFLQRLAQDWDAIRSTLSPEEDPGVLVAVEGGAGDSHRGGQSVHIARFSSDFRLVYKPRSMAVDSHFQDLLAWLNDRGAVPQFRVLRILDRGTHGWEEFVSPQPCTSAEEVGRFYQRQGAYLALLYVLAATDFHFENLVAAGEHPVLLDLEALFHPTPAQPAQESALDLAGSRFMYSVLISGLLPMHIWANAESRGIDLSGLGAAGGQLTPHAVPVWEQARTDEMRLARKRVIMPEGSNKPTLDEQAVDMLDYADALFAGFTAMYQLLQEHRHLLANGLLARFADDETRIILRNTRTYAMLLNESYHPDVLRDALDRERLLDRLWQAAEDSPEVARVIGAERADLLQGDVPIFQTRADSRHLWTSLGEVITDYFAESGLALVRRRLQALSVADLEQQLWFIRASLATVAPIVEEKPSHKLAPPLRMPDHEQYLATAQAVADRLSTLALRGSDDVLWLGLNFADEKHAVLATLGSNLYDGLSGMALFFGYLGAVTQDEEYTRLADAAIRTAHTQAEHNPALVSNAGVFSGWGGLIYALAHLGALWGDSSLHALALSLVDHLPALVEQDEGHDIISGSAGCIAGLLALYRCVASDRILAVATLAGEHLIEHAEHMDEGIAWRTKLGDQPLTGFSHGAAGIAWALLELAVVTNDERFRTAGLSAIAYERSTFRHEDENWPDFRIPEGRSEQRPSSKSQVTWCHGAPGIGLARLRSFRHVRDMAIREEIQIAVQTTLRSGFGRNHSLCHGDLGNLDFLLEASRVLRDSGLAAEVNRIAGGILAGVEAAGWECGVPLGVEVPGLMTGLAGIGYELLRLAEPERVPSILALDPPRLNRG